MKNRLLVDGAVSLRNWFLEPAICCSGSILNSLLKRLRKRALEGDLKLHSNTTSAGNPVLAAEIQTTSASNTDSSSEISSGIEQTICRTLSVLIPVYNERWTVATVIQRVLGTKVPLDLEIIAVDDAVHVVRRLRLAVVAGQHDGAEHQRDETDAAGNGEA